MIDIDIVEQLIPNPMTMLVQLCSTLVLFLLMKKFLWKSVKNFLDVRADKMQSDLAESEQAKQDALTDRQKALEELQGASARGEKIVEAAVKQAKDEKESILLEAGKQAEKASRDSLLEKQEEYLAELSKVMDVYDPTEEELQQFQDVAKSSWSMIENDMGSDLFNKVLEEAEKCKA